METTNKEPWRGRDSGNRVSQSVHLRIKYSDLSAIQAAAAKENKPVLAYKPKSDDEISGERPRRYLPMPKKWTTDDVIKRSEVVRKGAAEWLERMRRMYSGLNLNQYGVASPCRTICTVCGFVALS